VAKARIKQDLIIKEYINNLRNRIEINKVILFGSILKNNFNRNSDIDVIVLSNDFKKMGFLKRLELLSHARIGSSREIPMDIIGYTPDEFNKLSKESIVLKEVKRSGKIIWQ